VPSVLPRRAWCLLVVILGGCAAGAREGGTIARADSAGVRIVRLPRLAVAAPRWTAESLFSTASLDSIHLVGIVGAVFAPDTSLLIGDLGAVFRLDRSGRSMRRVARDGDGPGEFRGIFRLGIATDGSIFVGDVRTGRLTRIAPDGSLVRYIGRLSLDPAGRETDPIAVLGDGRIVATWWQGRANRGTLAGIPAGAFERDSMPLFAWRPETGLADTLGMWPGLERARVSLDGESRLPVPFSRSALFDGRGDLVVIGTSDSIDLFLFEGARLRLRLVGPDAHRRPTDPERNAWRRSLRESRPDIAEELLAAERDAPEVSELPGIGAVALDGSGNIWVGAYATPGQTLRTWWIFSPAADPIGRMELPVYTDLLDPTRCEILDVFGGRIALLREDRDGDLSVEVLRIRRH
jgi:hypothetical protein